MSEERDEGALLALRREPECVGPVFDAEGRLTFQRRSSGRRYFLGGRGVHAGDLLEMLLADGRWQPVRFEWNYQAADRPILFTNEETGFALPEGARFRWPR